MADPVKSLQDILNEFQEKHAVNIQDILNKIYKLLDDSATAIAYQAAKYKLLRDKSLPPAVRNIIDTIAKTVQSGTEKQIINGITYSWQLSDQKNTLIGRSFAGEGETVKLKLPPGYTAAKPAIQPAINAFIKLKQNGLNLSRKVFKVSNSFKKLVSDELKSGLEQGESARNLAKNIQKALRNPGPEKNENPGQGVYRSPKKNAERVTRSEINMAYSTADGQRWQTQWFVTGFQVKISISHPKKDICDFLQGIYPKDFNFVRWHPQCLCISIPVLAPQKLRDQMLDYQLGNRKTAPKINYVTDIPDSAKTYFSTNAQRINGWTNKPYYLLQNEKYLSEIFKKK